MSVRTRALLFFLTCLTGFVLSLPTAAEPVSGEIRAAQEKSVVDGALGEQIDSYLVRLAGFGFSGSVLVAKNGKIVLLKGYGLASQSNEIPNTPDTVYDLASLTKQFTAAAILKLQMAGKLKVGDPISKYLPTVPPDKANITIHQLLTHTSGMPNWSGGEYEEVSRDEALRRLFARKLNFVPGSRFAYSNGGYAVLAAVIEIASGQSYRTYLQQQLFEPAGMHNTGFWGKSAPAVSPLLIAHNYDELGEVGDVLAWSDTTWYGVGSNGATSTVGDLYKWWQALQGTSILSAAAKEQMFTPVMPSKEPSNRYYSSDYGYGWFVQTTPHGLRIQHGGDGIGSGSQFTWYKDEDVLLIVTCNIRHDLFPTIIKASYTIPKIIFGEQYSSPPDFVPENPEVATKAAGDYRLQSGGHLLVRRLRNQLEIGAEGQDAVNLLRGASLSERQQRTQLSAKAQTIFEGTVRGNFDAMAAALPPGDTIGYWRDGWPDEMRALEGNKGAFKSIDVLGTYPGGEPDSMHTLLRFNFEKGFSLYIVSWENGYFAGSNTRAPDLAAVTPLQAVSAKTFAGWDIATEDSTVDAFTVDFAPNHGAITDLLLRNRDQVGHAKRLNG